MTFLLSQYSQHISVVKPDGATPSVPANTINLLSVAVFNTTHII